MPTNLLATATNDCWANRVLWGLDMLIEHRCAWNCSLLLPDSVLKRTLSQVGVAQKRLRWECVRPAHGLLFCAVVYIFCRPWSIKRYVKTIKIWHSYTSFFWPILELYFIFGPSGLYGRLSSKARQGYMVLRQGADYQRHDWSSAWCHW